MSRFQKALLVVLYILIGCKEEEYIPSNSFVKIFDTRNFSASYLPIDIKQTSDGGYIILSGRRITDSNFTGIYIAKVDADGSFVSDFEMDTQFVHPVAEMMEIGGNFYFLCMQSTTLQTQLVEISQEGLVSPPQPLDGGTTYPSYASQDGNNFILLSYDNIGKQSILSTHTATGTITGAVALNIGAGEGVEAPIINHYLGTGKLLPFSAGRLNGNTLFFNGFYNYTFSLVFTDMNSATGVVQGQQANGGFSSILHINGNRFAASRFNFGDNYILPGVDLNTNGVSSSIDLGGNTVPEFASDAKMLIKQLTINNENYILYGSDSRSKQIVLYLYSENDGSFVGSKYLGFSNPFEIAAIQTTSDEGLIVLGTTFVAGRFPRICLFKISKEEVNNML